MYEEKFDPRRPMPGDSEFAAALKKARAAAMEKLERESHERYVKRTLEAKTRYKR